ncbi:MAG: hypothetical protein WBA40_10285 [Roseiarcus sp.]
MGRPQALRPIFDAYPRGVVAMATIRKKPILGRIAAKFVNFQFFEDDVTVQQDVPQALDLGDDADRLRRARLCLLPQPAHGGRRRRNPSKTPMNSLDPERRLKSRLGKIC